MTSDPGPTIGAGYVTTMFVPPKVDTHEVPQRPLDGRGGCATTHPAGNGIVSEVAVPQPYVTDSV